MAKRKQYDLVGYVYDRCSKDNKFKEEEIIKIPGVLFDSLEDIDKFTANFSSLYDLSEYLGKNYENKTRFSIRISDNSERFSYRSVIYNNPSLSEVIDKLKEGTIIVAGKKRTVKLYTGSSTYFKDIWEIVEKKILEEDRDWFNQIFSGSWYLTLINQYFNRDPFEISPSITILDLERAFKDYGVLRKYLTFKENSVVSNLNVTTSNIPTETIIDKSEVKTGNYTDDIAFDDEEDDYDKEEFFDEKELGMMAGDGDVPFGFRGRRI